MRIGELARRAGVPAPTIKYYTREGLLPAGERTGPNQVRYGEAHVRRLRLIRALLDVGGLSVAAAREVLREVEVPDRAAPRVPGAAQAALGLPADRLAPTAGGLAPTAGRPAPPADGSAAEPPGTGARAYPDGWQRAEGQVDALLARNGWTVPATSAGRRALVQTVAAYRDLEQHELLGLLDQYAQTAGELTTAELEMAAAAPDAATGAETALLGTLLGDAALTALRRIAQEHAAEQRADSAAAQPGATSRTPAVLPAQEGGTHRAAPHRR